MSLPQVPILTYHGLDEAASPLFISPAKFEAQLAALADRGYKTIPLAVVLDKLRHGEPFAENSVVITFDDGYESVYREAWPRLRAFGFTATVFLITDYCGRDNRWPGQPAWVPTRPLLSWTQIETLGAEGCEFGAHTCTHPALVNLELGAARDEIILSQQIIHDHTGQLARVFAYPYGAVNSQIHEIVHQHFDGALGTRLGLVQTQSNPYALERVDAYYLQSNPMLPLDRRSFQVYLKWRQVLRDTRRWFSPDWRPVRQANGVNR